jgi:hypothetical protein
MQLLYSLIQPISAGVPHSAQVHHMHLEPPPGEPHRHGQIATAVFRIAVHDHQGRRRTLWRKTLVVVAVRRARWFYVFAQKGQLAQGKLSQEILRV